MNHSSSINVHTTVCLIGGMGDNFFLYEGEFLRVLKIENLGNIAKKIGWIFWREKGEFLFNQLFAPLSNWMNTLISYCAVCRNFLAVLLNMHYSFPSKMIISVRESYYYDYFYYPQPILMEYSKTEERKREQYRTHI